MEQIREFIGQVVLVGGGATGIAYLFLKWFGQKWFENRFAESLEEFKRGQSELLEQFKFEVNSRFNRITKIHEKEFEVLPSAWYKLQDAYGALVGVASPGQDWPSLNDYSTDQLESFLEQCELLDFQKQELRAAVDKLAYYQEKSYWRRLNAARKLLQEFKRYLAYNRIFLSKDLFGLFRKIELAMIEVEVELENPEDKPWVGTSKLFTKLTKDVNAIMEQVEEVVQKRLHFDQA